jgi:hypothetical protein
MKVIAPYSPELRELKAKAIIELDRLLLEQLQDVEGKEFAFCETFQDALQASSFEDEDLPTVEATSLREVFKQFTEGSSPLHFL